MNDLFGIGWAAAVHTGEAAPAQPLWRTFNPSRVAGLNIPPGKPQPVLLYFSRYLRGV